MSELNDTSPEAERVLIEVYRRMSPAEKWRRLGTIYRRAKLLHAAGVRSRNLAAGPQDIREDWIRVTLGEPTLRILKELNRDGGR